ncbi:MAG: CoA transferase [Chloroflexi bacterium]|nr:CoA transferase [Chloroflexota bacterium]
MPQREGEQQHQQGRLQTAVERFFATRTREEIYREARARRFLSFPVQGPPEIFRDEQIQSRDFFREVEHGELNERIVYPGGFVKTTAGDYGVRRRPPLIGEHNEEVFLEELGLTRDELITLREAGIV